MDPTLLQPHPADADESSRSSLVSPATSFGEPDSSWELQHDRSANTTDSSFDQSSDDITAVLGTLKDTTPWSVRKAAASSAATAARIEIPEPTPSRFSSTTGPTTGSPPSSRFSAWSTGSFVYGRESPPPCMPGTEEVAAGGSESPAGRTSLLSPQPLRAPFFPHVGRSLSDPPASLSPASPSVKTLHKTLSADSGEARELGLMQRELSPRPLSRTAGVSETAGEGADEVEAGNVSPVLMPVPDRVADAIASPTIAGLIATAKANLGASVELDSTDLTPAPLRLDALGHRDSLAASDQTDGTDDSCPFFYSPPPLQSNFVRSSRDPHPAVRPTEDAFVPRASPAPLDLSQPGASYAFPDPTALATHPGVSLSAPIPTYPPLHADLLRRASTATSAGSDGSAGSGTRSFGWVHDLYDLYSPAGEPAVGSEEVGRLDLAGEGEEGGARFADEAEDHFDSPGFRIWRDDAAGGMNEGDSSSSEPGTAPAMQSVFAALQALGTPKPAGSEYEGSFVTACSSARASPRPSPLGSPLPDPVRLLLSGTATTGDDCHLRRIGSNTSLLLEPPSPGGKGKALELRPGTPDVRDLESELLAARGVVFGLENEVHNLRAQLEGARAGEEKALRTARWAEEMRARAEAAEAKLAAAGRGAGKEIDDLLADLGVDLNVSSALFLSPQVAFLPVCPHCSLPVQATHPQAAAGEHDDGTGNGNGAARVDDEPNLDAWVTTHLACLPHITEVLAFVQEPEEVAEIERVPQTVEKARELKVEAELWNGHAV